MTTASTGAVASLPVLLKRRREARLPDPAKRRQIRESAGLSREDIAGALRAEGDNVTAASVTGWELPRERGGWDPRPARAVAYRRLLERIEAEVASWAKDQYEALLPASIDGNGI
jgi:hypothetical protein